MTQPMNSTQPNNTTHSPSLIAGKDVKDFQLTAPMVDVRGWNVVGPTGQQIGTVDRIMLDRTEQKPRYLSVALPKTTEYLLLPIGLGSVESWPWLQWSSCSCGSSRSRRLAASCAWTPCTVWRQS